MKFLKNNLKLLIGFIIGAILTGGIVYAAVSAGEVNYTRQGTNVSNVAEALNELYEKSNKTAVQVATLTSQGATYTMQNDGYISGTVKSNEGGGFVYFNGTNVENIVYYTNYTDNKAYHASIYAPKGTVVSTRTSYGVYNLTVYEFK